jgi:hypothetical protein
MSIPMAAACMTIQAALVHIEYVEPVAATSSGTKELPAGSSGAL